MRRASVLAAFAALVTAMAGCTQDDQVLSIDLADDEPVTRTAPAAGEMTISTPAGISVTLPEGAVPAGTKVTVARIDPRDIAGLPATGADAAYLLTFDRPPTKAPRVSFKSTLRGTVALSDVIAAVPVVLPVSNGAAASLGPAAAPAWSVVPAASPTQPRANDLPSYIGWFVDPPSDDLLPHFPDITAFTTPPVDFSSLPSGQYNAIRPWFDIDSLFNDITVNNPSFQQTTSNDLESNFEQLLLRYSCVEAIDACAFVIVTMPLGNTPFATPYPEPMEIAHPIIPEGQSSATFALACTGVAWNEETPTCGGDVLDARASRTLLDRYKGAIAAVNFIAAYATLHDDGVVEGTIRYDLALRVPTASGVHGYPLADSLDVTGRWSVDGDRITVGGYTFNYATPDPDYLVLAVADSVKMKHNDGTESWEPVQVHLKLWRVSAE